MPLSAKFSNAAFGIVLALGVAASLSPVVPAPPPSGPGVRVRDEFASQVAALAASLDTLGAKVASGSAADVESAFRAGRRAYKRAETLLQFYAPILVRDLDGPAPDADPDLPPPPLGAPSAWERLYDALGDRSQTGRTRAQAESARMARAVRAFAANIPLLSVSDSALLDAARLEIARISTLGLAGVGSPRLTDALGEEAAAFDGMRALFRAGPARAGLDAAPASAADIALASAASALRHAPDFDAFDRLAFIVRHANVAARAIAATRVAAGIGSPALRRAWREKAATVFDSGAFDASAYAPEFAQDSPAMLALGRRLFFDPRLSGPGTRSCSSCHDPARAFADAMARPATLEAAQPATARNTPTVVNAALQPMLFADQRAGSLEEQVARVLSSPAEMQSSPELAGQRVHEPALTVRIALAAYLRSLTALDSRADRALRGDTAALSLVERMGFTVFMGKGRCATCHYVPLTGGTVPPVFDESEPEIIGVPARMGVHHATIDADSGRERVDHAITHRFAFRVPSLRNVALTAPYMHNGAYATLDDVVDFYDRGGGRGIGAAVDGQTLDAHPLNLTAAEKTALVAFMRSLTDSTPMTRERAMQQRPR